MNVCASLEIGISIYRHSGCFLLGSIIVWFSKDERYSAKVTVYARIDSICINTYVGIYVHKHICILYLTFAFPIFH